MAPRIARLATELLSDAQVDHTVIAELRTQPWGRSAAEIGGGITRVLRGRRPGRSLTEINVPANSASRGGAASLAALDHGHRKTAGRATTGIV